VPIGSPPRNLAVWASLFRWLATQAEAEVPGT